MADHIDWTGCRMNVMDRLADAAVGLAVETKL
jgi:hypothetical protein